MATPLPLWERFDAGREIGRHVLGFAEVGSTMDVVWERFDAGASHGTVVQAATQSQGRGRFARRWVSNPGESLLISALVTRPPTTIGALLPNAATLAVADTVRAVAGIGCAIKWPNDVIVNGLKIAGVLVESRVDTDGGGAAVVGIGLNVNLGTGGHADLAGIATSLSAETGGEHDLRIVAASLLTSLESALKAMLGPGQIIERWRSILDTLGQEITVHQRERTLTGTAEDVDDAGHLLLRTADGMLHTLSEGDVTLNG
jgi:BirA family biotin operon repressor/biotin-[acetyl-CoA-carboxylase] ligase